MKRKPSGKGGAGFTLLELLMVVVIIGILASLAVPQYMETAERSRASAALELIAHIRDAEMRYSTLNGAFTGDFNALDIHVPGDCPVPPTVCTSLTIPNGEWVLTVADRDASLSGLDALEAKRLGGPNTDEIISIFIETGQQSSAHTWDPNL